MGLITLIYKREDKGEVENYRGITLLNTAYKVYAGILNQWLIEEVDEKLAESQLGFRKGCGTMEAIYVANFIISRQLNRKGGKVFLFFADLKVAFDYVDRRELERMLSVLRMNGKLKKAVMEILKETKNRRREHLERILDGEGSHAGFSPEPDVL